LEQLPTQHPQALWFDGVACTAAQTRPHGSKLQNLMAQQVRKEHHRTLQKSTEHINEDFAF
jgi:hypothetical protein